MKIYAGSTGVCCAAVLLFFLNAIAGAVTVPMIVEGNAPIIEVDVSNGAKHRKAKFLIDTGGGTVQLGSRLMADIGAVPIGDVIEEGGDRFIPLKAPVLSIAGSKLNLTGVEVFGLPNNVRAMARNDVEGILSAAILRKYRVIFDYPNRKFTLDERKGKPVGRPVPTPISATSGYPRIEVEVGGQRHGFLLDTGASFTMASETAMSHWSRANSGWRTGRGAVGFANMFGNAIDRDGLMLIVPELRIGSFVVADAGFVSRPEGTYEKWMSGMMTAPIVGALAGNVLRDFRVEIDYQAGITYLQQTGRSSQSDLSTIGLVIGLANNGDPVIVGFASGAAQDTRDKLMVRDRLLAINGSPVTGHPIAVVSDMLSGPEGSARMLRINRGGREVTILVHTKRLP